MVSVPSAKSNVDLLRKHVAGVLLAVVGGEVAGPLPQLPLRCGEHGIVRQAEEQRRHEFHSPAEPGELLGQARPDEAPDERIASLVAGVEPVPAFGAGTERGTPLQGSG
jgi:hypothetical protein